MSAPDPASQFIAEVDAAPAEKRPPNWDRVKALMARTLPALGAPAPGFRARRQRFWDTGR